MRDDASTEIPAAIRNVYEAGDDRLHAVAISPAEGRCLQRIFEAEDVRVTLEIGCAYGLSSMFICDSLARKSAGCLHTIIDPYQSSVFARHGVKNLEAAGLRCFELLEEPSELALPRLLASGARFDAALIDGYHTFDQTIVDLYYVTRLLRVGGYLALDDCNLPAVNRAARYLITYPCYRVVDSTAQRSTRRKVMTGAKWVIATLLKPVTWPLGKASYEFFDGSLIEARVLRVADAARMLVLQKISEDERWAWWFEYLEVRGRAGCARREALIRRPAVRGDLQRRNDRHNLSDSSTYEEVPMSSQPPSVKSFRPFLPAKDFAASKRFYQHLGFSIAREWQGGAEFALGTSSFILTDFYVEQFASNFMMQLVVVDVDEWWKHLQAAKLAETFQVPQPKPPTKQPWGLVVAYFTDPSSVLWHVTPGNTG